jgi:hypothetical protein
MGTGTRKTKRKRKSRRLKPRFRIVADWEAGNKTSSRCFGCEYGRGVGRVVGRVRGFDGDLVDLVDGDGDGAMARWR